MFTEAYCIMIETISSNKTLRCVTVKFSLVKSEKLKTYKVRLEEST